MGTKQEDDAWEQIASRLEDVMSRLAETDRNAIVLRFFENKHLKEVAAALGITERAAQKRVERAVEKLRVLLTKRQVVVPSILLTSILASHAVQPAPIAMAGLGNAAGLLSPSANSALLKGTAQLIAWAKFKTTLIATVALVLAGGGSTLITVSMMASYRATDQNTSLNPATRKEIFKSFLAGTNAIHDLQLWYNVSPILTGDPSHANFYWLYSGTWSPSKYIFRWNTSSNGLDLALKPIVTWARFNNQYWNATAAEIYFWPDAGTPSGSSLPSFELSNPIWELLHNLGLSHNRLTNFTWNGDTLEAFDGSQISGQLRCSSDGLPQSITFQKQGRSYQVRYYYAAGNPQRILPSMFELEEIRRGRHEILKALGIIRLRLTNAPADREVLTVTNLFSTNNSFYMITNGGDSRTSMEDVLKKLKPTP